MTAIQYEKYTLRKVYLKKVSELISNLESLNNEMVLNGVSRIDPVQVNAIRALRYVYKC